MSSAGDNRFQEFFEEPYYLALKNHLYNYRLRKEAVERACRPGVGEWVLEVGSGVSPVMTRTERVVYSDLSFEAMQVLRRDVGRGRFVVADGTKLPFRNDSFQHAICSEVLEHMSEDRVALGELSRVLKTTGKIVITFPHRRIYFSNDDRFVGHHRRYELPEMEGRLREAGLQPVLVQKVLGPLEKLTMSLAVFVVEHARRFRRGTPRRRTSAVVRLIVPLFKWVNRLFAAAVWLDAQLMPRRLAAVLLICAEMTGRARQRKVGGKRTS